MTFHLSCAINFWGGKKVIERIVTASDLPKLQTISSLMLSVGKRETGRISSGLGVIFKHRYYTNDQTPLWFSFQPYARPGTTTNSWGWNWKFKKHLACNLLRNFLGLKCWINADKHPFFFLLDYVILYNGWYVWPG